MDYIGIDAYFPLSEARHPDADSLRTAWIPWKEKILEVQQAYGIPVIFTEFGYRSMDHTASKPWLVDHLEEGLNLEAQALATEVLLETFWTEGDWFAGGFVWKWFPIHELSGGSDDNRFTPQNKPAQKVLQRFYRRY